MTTYACEIEGCHQDATVEYRWHDEDSNPYYEYRCDTHPKTEDYFEAIRVPCPVCGEDMDSGHYNNNAECAK